MLDLAERINKLPTVAIEHTRNQDRVERVRRLLKSPRPHVRALISVLHPTEIAQVLEEASPELQERILREVSKELISEAISEMDEETNPGQLLMLLHPEVAYGLIKELEPDDAADLLSQIPDENRDSILAFMPDDEEIIINQLLTYDEESAGGRMNPDVLTIRADMTKLQALREVVAQSEEKTEFYAIYVVDEERHLLGYLTFKYLFTAKNMEKVQDIMDPRVVSVYVDDDQEEVAKLMSQYNLPTLPVVDRDNVLLGRITFDDILDVLEDETTEDILNFAGVSEDENLRGGWASAVKSRIPWLLVNVITASIASYVIKQFEPVLNQIVVLAAFMPVVAGVAGNGATQALAVTIRRISTDGIPRRKALRVILKEVMVGVSNGLLIGLIVSVLAFYLGGSYKIGLVVALAMMSNLVLAGLAGSFIPITLERLGVDPAIASSILITAFTDIIGYTLLFGLATKILL